MKGRNLNKTAGSYSLLPPGARIRWLASFPKSGNTWVRLFMANLLVAKGRPLTLQEFSAIPYYTDQGDKKSGTKGIHFGKAHYTYTPEIHGDEKSIYIMRDPLDIVPSAADFFGTNLDRMAKEVANDWPRHVNSWLGHCDLVLKYENMPQNFHTLNQHIGLDRGFHQCHLAILHSSFDGLRRDEQEHGFGEGSDNSRDGFFRKGRTGEGRERLSKSAIKRLTTGLCGEVRERFRYK